MERKTCPNETTVYYSITKHVLFRGKEQAPAIFCVRSPKTTPYNVYFLSLTGGFHQGSTDAHVQCTMMGRKQI